MGKLIWVAVLAAIVGGGWYWWQSKGSGGVASYQAEKLAGKVCNDMMRDLNVNQEGKVQAAIESGRQMFKDEAQERVGRTFDDSDFNFGIEGKTCKAAINVTDAAGKTETVRFSKTY
jgi:hypothetical protein